MAVTYANSLKDTRMTAVITALDTASGFATIDIASSAGFTSGILVTITLAKPSFTEASEAITMAGAPKSGTAGATGTATQARIKDGAGTVVVSGLTVGTSAADIILNSTSITNGQTVTLSSAVITHG
jgi:hypothetical protein